MWALLTCLATVQTRCWTPTLEWTEVHCWAPMSKSPFEKLFNFVILLHRKVKAWRWHMDIQYLKKNNNLAFNIATAIQQFDCTRITKTIQRRRGRVLGFDEWELQQLFDMEWLLDIKEKWWRKRKLTKVSNQSSSRGHWIFPWFSFLLEERIDRMTFLLSSLCVIKITDITANLKLNFSSQLNVSKVHFCHVNCITCPKLLNLLINKKPELRLFWYDFRNNPILAHFIAVPHF